MTLARYPAAVVALVLALCAPSGAQGTDMASRIADDPTVILCNSRPYRFDTVSDTPAPRGYKPVYISHYGRHGSRTGWGDEHYTGIISSLEAASREGILTPQGDSLLNETRRAYAVHDGMDGRLLPRGVCEQRTLAERMCGRFPRVFRGKDRTVRAMASFVPRCIVSMNAFTAALTAFNPSIDLRPDTGEKFFHAYINNYGPDELTSGAKPLCREISENFPDDTVSIRSVLFTDPARSREMVPSVSQFQDWMFASAILGPCMGIGEDMFRYMPADAVFRRWVYTNSTSYARYGNCRGFGEKRMDYAEGLVDDIVSKADEALAGGTIVADLRFGHDWALLGLISYLGLEGVAPKLSVEEISGAWSAAENLCMSSNIQFVFYRNRKGDVLVKVLYQEKERLLRGLEPVSGPYYRWNEIKHNLKGYDR